MSELVATTAIGACPAKQNKGTLTCECVLPGAGTGPRKQCFDAQGHHIRHTRPLGPPAKRQPPGGRTKASLGAFRPDGTDGRHSSGRCPAHGSTTTGSAMPADGIRGGSATMVSSTTTCLGTLPAPACNRSMCTNHCADYVGAGTRHVQPPGYDPHGGAQPEEIPLAYPQGHPHIRLVLPRLT